MDYKTLTLIGCGGALGAVCRYVTAMFISNEPFAYATLTANIAGSFFLVLLTALLTAKLLSPALKPLIGTGFCGGFTTMSTFTGELYRYIEASSFLTLASYLSFSLIGGLAAGAAGWRMGTAIIHQIGKERDK